MKRATLLAAAALAAATAPAALVINEVDSDTPGTDTLEFVELYNTGPGPIDFSSTSYQVVFFNGGTTSPVDGSYVTADLTSGTVNAGGYVIIGSSGITGSVTADVEVTVSNNTIQNGSDAIALYTGTPYGASASPTTTNLVDAIVYDTNDSDDAVLQASLGVSNGQVNEDGAGDKDNDSLSRYPDGAGVVQDAAAFTPQTPSPAAGNLPVELDRFGVE